MGFVTLPRPLLLPLIDIPLLTSAGTVDAVGESVAFIGQCWLSSGPGTSATVSPGDGSTIYASLGAVTFANVGTTLRVGIQDVNLTTGIEDGVYDVNGDVIGTAGTLTANALNGVAMTTGTKTIAHGDFIAVVWEFTARAGVDTIQVNSYNPTPNANFPYTTRDVGAGPVKSATLPFTVFSMSGGVVGYFGPPFTVPYILTTVSFNSGSTPDEYVMAFSWPVPMRITGLMIGNGEVDAGENAELILYSDPLGGAVPERTITIDPDVVANAAANSGFTTFQCAAYDVPANTVIGVAYRPTTTGNRLLTFATIPFSNARKVLPVGVTVQGGSRINQSGAFGTLTSTVIPLMGVMVSALESGGGGSIFSSQGGVVV